eukprot:895451_1
MSYFHQQNHPNNQHSPHYHQLPPSMIPTHNNTIRAQQRSPTSPYTGTAATPTTSHQLQQLRYQQQQQQQQQQSQQSQHSPHSHYYANINQHTPYNPQPQQQPQHNNNHQPITTQHHHLSLAAIDSLDSLDMPYDTNTRSPYDNYPPTQPQTHQRSPNTNNTHTTMNSFELPKVQPIIPTPPQQTQPQTQTHTHTHTQPPAYSGSNESDHNSPQSIDAFPDTLPVLDEQNDHSYDGGNKDTISDDDHEETPTYSTVAVDIRGSRQYLRQKQYWIAVHRNKKKELAWVLRSRQHVNLLEYNEQEQLGIIIVALRHNWPCLKLLIKHGGGLRHLVRYAALHGEIEILKYLHEILIIDMSSILDNADETLLFSAIEGSQSSVVSLLCKYGANLHGLSTEGESPVILAAKKGELEIIKILGQNQVDLTIADDQGNTVAHYASQVYNGKHILSYLHTLKNKLSSSNNGNNNGSEYGGDLTDIDYFNRQNKRGATAAYNASWKGQIDNLEVLKEIGADFTISNNDGNNCLIGAAMNDQPMIVNYLLDECKLDIDYSNDCQETALYWASSNGCCGCVETLVKHKSNLECADKYGITPLMVAAEHGEQNACNILLNAGANPNHQNQDGETALMKACAEGFIDCVKILIQSNYDNNKCDYKITDDEGNPAILWCCMTGNMEIFKYLVNDSLKLTKEDIENTINNDKETCIDWIVENKL